MNNSCNSNFDCTEKFYECENGICVLPQKQCLSGCSGQGECVFVKTDSGLPVSDCRVGYPDCSAICVCNSNFNLSSTCSVSNADLTLKQSYRVALLNNLNLLLELEDVTFQSVSVWLNMLNEAASISDEMNLDSYELVISLAIKILEASETVSLPYTTTAAVLTAINSATLFRSQFNGLKLSSSGTRDSNVQTFNTSSGDTIYVTDGTGITVNSSVSTSLTVIRKFLDVISSDLVPGQRGADMRLSEIRIRCEYYSALPSALASIDASIIADIQNASYSDMNNSNGPIRLVDVSVPPSQLEEQTDDLSSYASLSVPLSEQFLATDNFLLASIRIRSQDFGSQGLFRSTLTAYLPAVTDPYKALISSLADHNVIVIFGNVERANNFTKIKQENVSANCYYGFPEVRVHTCESGARVNLSCSGSFTGVVRSQCPTAVNYTVCNALTIAASSVTSVPSGCTNLRITSSDRLLAFSCPFQSIFQSYPDLVTDPTTLTRRRLGRPLHAPSNIGSSALSVMAATESTYYANEESVWATSVRLSSSTGSVVLFSAVGGLLLLLLLLLLPLSVAIFITKKEEKNSNLTVKKRENGKEREMEYSGFLRMTREKGQGGEMDFSRFSLQSEFWLMEQSLPYVLNGAVTLTWRMIALFVTCHRWVRLASHGTLKGVFTTDIRTSFRLSIAERLQIFLHVLIFFFFQCLFLFVLDGETNCNEIYNERTCKGKHSAFLSGDRICAWNIYASASSERYGYCSYIPPSDRLSSLVFCAFYAALCALPFMFLNSFVLENVVDWSVGSDLTEPDDDAKRNVSNESERKNDENEENEAENRLSVDDIPHLDELVHANLTLEQPSVSSGTFPRGPSVFQETSVDEYSLISMGDLVLAAMDVTDGTAGRARGADIRSELGQLFEEIRSQYLTLPDDQKDYFKSENKSIIFFYL